MRNTIHKIALLLVSVVVVLAFLVGVISAPGGLALPSVALGQNAPLDAQWAALQASNSLLEGGAFFYTYLPLLGSN